MTLRAKLFVTAVVAAALLAFIAAGDSLGQPEEGTLASDCADGPLEAKPATVTLGSSGQISFACDFDPFDPALTVTRTNVKAIPHLLGFLSPYQSLWIYRADHPLDASDSGACNERGGPARQLHDGQRLTIPGQKTWNYCAEYVDVGSGGLPGFQVRWEAA